MKTRYVPRKTSYSYSAWPATPHGGLSSCCADEGLIVTVPQRGSYVAGHKQGT